LIILLSYNVYAGETRSTVRGKYAAEEPHKQEEYKI